MPVDVAATVDGAAEAGGDGNTGTGTAGPSPSLAYKPGLDGLRGIAVLAIIVYHSGLPWMPGAFLSVSTFFTLSGFLTAVMLGEHGRHGSISLKRVLGPTVPTAAARRLLAIAGIVLFATFLADGNQLSWLRGDALASLFYVANWRFIAVGDVYGQQFASPSPFGHFWTLSIEEQFYLAFLLLLVAALAIGPWAAGGSWPPCSGLTLLSVAWAAFLLHRGSSVDRIYYGTDTRAAELLTGALLATWWMHRPDPVSERARRPVQMLGVVALVVVVALWATANLDQRTYYEGGLAAYSRCSPSWCWPRPCRTGWWPRCSAGGRWSKWGWCPTAPTCSTGRSSCGSNCTPAAARRPPRGRPAGHPRARPSCRPIFVERPIREGRRLLPPRSRVR